MVEKLKHYLEGIGSVLDLFPESRDLTVHNPAPPAQNIAFARDAAALRKDFDRAISAVVSHGQETQAD